MIYSEEVYEVIKLQLTRGRTLKLFNLASLQSEQQNIRL